MSDDCQTCIVYASIDDFDSCGIPAAAVSNVPMIKWQAALVRASRIADTFLRDRYHLPLRCPVDPALTQWVVYIAVYIVMGVRGFNPNANAIDMIVRMNYEDSLKSLRNVANGQQQLCVVQAAPPSDQPQMSSSPSRGFTAPGGEDVPGIGPNTWGN